VRSTTVVGANALVHMESLPSHRSIEVDFNEKRGGVQRFLKNTWVCPVISEIEAV
jgi:hypothetical protein